MQEIIKPDNNELAIVKELERQGLDDSFIVDLLKHIATNAITQNNKGDEIEDFHAKLKAIQTILKIKTGGNDWPNINLNFFKPPDSNKLKY